LKRNLLHQERTRPSLRHYVLASLALCLTYLAAVPVRAADSVAAPRHTQTAASPDGIGKVYMEREISGVMDWQGAAWLERQERDKEERRRPAAA
jgi:hypothetical protein